LGFVLKPWVLSATLRILRVRRVKVYIFINNNSTPPGVSTLMKEPRQEMDRALKRAAKGEDLMVETASEAAGTWMEFGSSIVLLSHRIHGAGIYTNIKGVY